MIERLPGKMWRGAAAATALTASAMGCASDPTQGYTFGSAFASDIQTVAVPVWDNTTFMPGLEMRLTEALVKEIHRSTPWAVTDASSAETVLTGEIDEASLRSLNTDSTSGLVQEQALELAVNFRWRDNRSGESLATRRNFRETGVFVPKAGAGEPIETAEQGAIEALARDIVAELRSAW